jgi:hypothetical protein
MVFTFETLKVYNHCTFSCKHDRKQSPGEPETNLNRQGKQSGCVFRASSKTAYRVFSKALITNSERGNNGQIVSSTGTTITISGRNCKGRALKKTMQPEIGSEHQAAGDRQAGAARFSALNRNH